ncbi:fertility inhibition FinO-like protein [Nostoc sp. CHAB 5836]|jgi:hypothetical protein|uniref:fertility inhibition FinO-like protein n=1 Tax=Nostoc sp. CHAB 5836 TaxID=2780404 RepID=UPI001E60A209|nr:fertility inhibition FinO-like protein [Nostoc sp. CHAB 5836]MCC5619324.1 fertility inhibition FinO-like protein [Nostoc sp. CHAB 5836]
MITVKLGFTTKINELPQAKILENSWQQFDIDCNGRIISVTVKPKVWKKLTDAQADNRFVLDEPNIQVFERKPKPEATATTGAT